MASETAEAIYFGGPILTMNDAQPRAEAVAVAKGRILAVGGAAEVRALAGPATAAIDLGGRALLPGFFDAHGHVYLVGLQALSANLLPAPDGEGNSIAAIQRLLREWIARNRPFIERYQLVVGFGYDDSQLDERRPPTRDELDAVSTEVPVVILHQSGHLGVANGRALELAGVGASTPDPEGGVFRRRAGGTEPNGVMEEHAFFAVFGRFSARFDRELNLAMARAGAEFYARFGYTTAQEARAFKPAVATMRAAAEQGLFAIDVLAYPDIAAATDTIAPPALSPDYHGRFRVGGAKLTIDGSPQGKTAWLTQPYFVVPEGRPSDYRGYPAIPPEKAIELVDLAFARNWQLLVHANGDAAIDLTLDAVRRAEAKHGRGDRRTVLVHGQTMREDQLDLARELGVLPSLFPMHTFYWGDWHRASVLGPERAERISPTGSALRRGMRFTTHHDAPVANPDSMRVLSATVTRRTRSGHVLGPDQRVSVDVALKAMTLWPAYQHFEERTKGSIEVGKLADLVILSADPLAVAPEDLAALRVVETIKEGKVVYAAP